MGSRRPLVEQALYALPPPRLALAAAGLEEDHAGPDPALALRVLDEGDAMTVIKPCRKPVPEDELRRGGGVELCDNCGGYIYWVQPSWNDKLPGYWRHQPYNDRRRAGG